MLSLKQARVRTRTALLTTISLLAWCGAISGAQAESVSTGEAAPDFRLLDQNGKWHDLQNYCGQWVVLYFYPKDDTPGCTTQACEFRDEIYAFRKNNINILGVSLDDVESHEEFAEKYSLPFSLLADAEKEVATTYGVLKNYGVVKYSARETFLIDPQGNIAKHYKKVDPDGHAIDVINSVKSLSAQQAGSGDSD